MAVGSVLIALQASFPDGRDVTTENFLAPLAIQSGEEVEYTRADGGQWASGLVCYPITRLSAFANEDEPAEAFFAGVKEALRAAGRFLDRRSSEVTAAL